MDRTADLLSELAQPIDDRSSCFIRGQIAVLSEIIDLPQAAAHALTRGIPEGLDTPGGVEGY